MALRCRLSLPCSSWRFLSHRRSPSERCGLLERSWFGEQGRRRFFEQTGQPSAKASLSAACAILSRHAHSSWLLTFVVALSPSSTFHFDGDLSHPRHKAQELVIPHPKQADEKDKIKSWCLTLRVPSSATLIWAPLSMSGGDGMGGEGGGGGVGGPTAATAATVGDRGGVANLAQVVSHQGGPSLWQGWCQQRQRRSR